MLDLKQTVVTSSESTRSFINKYRTSKNKYFFIEVYVIKH